MFPDELPRRLIKMFTFKGETVLDPFLGSGTTAKEAINLDRNGIGYEINENFLETIKTKLGLQKDTLQFTNNIEIIKRKAATPSEPINYLPRIKDAKPVIDPNKFNFKGEKLYRVTEIVDEMTLKLNTGLIVKFLGIKISDKEQTIKYLKDKLLRKEVLLKFDKEITSDDNTVHAYVYLKNKIFINAYLIRAGLAIADKTSEHKQKSKFIKLAH